MGPGRGGDGPSPPDGRLPDADKGSPAARSRTSAIFMGADDRDIVALSGAHARSVPRGLGLLGSVDLRRDDVLESTSVFCWRRPGRGRRRTTVGSGRVRISSSTVRKTHDAAPDVALLCIRPSAPICVEINQ